SWRSTAAPTPPGFRTASISGSTSSRRFTRPRPSSASAFATSFWPRACRRRCAGAPRSSRNRLEGRPSGSADAVLLEPGEHLRPAVLGGLGAVARPVVGIEGVRRVRVDLDLAGLAGRLARRRHLLDGVARDPLIGGAVKPEHL